VNVGAFPEAHAARKRPAHGTMMALIAEFKAAAEFTTKSEASKKNYLRYLRVIETEFGDMPIKALSDPAVRGVFKAWRDGMADKPRAADYGWVTLARVFSIAKDRGRIPVNPCERGGRIYQADRSKKIWGAAEITKVLSVASADMKLALMLAIWTGQSQGDLLALCWSDYDGRRFRLTRRKTGQAIVVRAGQPLRALLSRTKPKGPLILTNSRGMPRTSDGFRTSWRKLCSAITRLALAGCTPPEIASVTGHALADVCAMHDRHYLGDRAASAKWGSDVVLRSSNFTDRDVEKGHEPSARSSLGSRSYTCNKASMISARPHNRMRKNNSFFRVSTVDSRRGGLRPVWLNRAGLLVIGPALPAIPPLS
jgi:integrase